MLPNLTSLRIEPVGPSGEPASKKMRTDGTPSVSDLQYFKETFFYPWYYEWSEQFEGLRQEVHAQDQCEEKFWTQLDMCTTPQAQILKMMQFALNEDKQQSLGGDAWEKIPVGILYFWCIMEVGAATLPNLPTQKLTLDEKGFEEIVAHALNAVKDDGAKTLTLWESLSTFVKNKSNKFRERRRDMIDNKSWMTTKKIHSELQTYYKEYVDEEPPSLNKDLIIALTRIGQLDLVRPTQRNVVYRNRLEETQNNEILLLLNADASTEYLAQFVTLYGLESAHVDEELREVMRKIGGAIMADERARWERLNSAFERLWDADKITEWWRGYVDNWSVMGVSRQDYVLYLAYREYLKKYPSDKMTYDEFEEKMKLQIEGTERT